MPPELYDAAADLVDVVHVTAAVLSLLILASSDGPDPGRDRRWWWFSVTSLRKAKKALRSRAARGEALRVDEVLALPPVRGIPCPVPCPPNRTASTWCRRGMSAGS